MPIPIASGWRAPPPYYYLPPPFNCVVSLINQTRQPAGVGLLPFWLNELSHAHLINVCPLLTSATRPSISRLCKCPAVPGSYSSAPSRALGPICLVLLARTQPRAWIRHREAAPATPPTAIKSRPSPYPHMETVYSFGYFRTHLDMKHKAPG